jgi:hypothetical protein
MLDEHDVARRVDVSRGDVVAAVPTVTSRVAEEDTCLGARTEFVRRRRSQVGVAEGDEDA